HPRFRFFGGVEFGKDVTLADLRAHYHQIVYCTGAQTDRRMGIPGEDLRGSHPATEFVAWYNGHPDYRDSEFDLSVECAAVVGVGNVAVDVARILCRTPEELATTDIADDALEALARSRIREVYLLGRRGPAQAAFTNPEIKELGELAGADIEVRPDEVELDPLSRAAVERSQDRATLKKVEILQGYALRPATGKPRRLIVRFLVSPVELLGDAAGRGLDQAGTDRRHRDQQARRRRDRAVHVRGLGAGRRPPAEPPGRRLGRGPRPAAEAQLRLLPGLAQAQRAGGRPRARAGPAPGEI